MVWRNEPAPLSSVLVTVKLVAIALPDQLQTTRMVDTSYVLDLYLLHHSHYNRSSPMGCSCDLYLTVNAVLPQRQGADSMQPTTASSTSRRQFSAWLADEFRPHRLVRTLLTAGLIFGLEVVFCVSFTALIYGNELATYLPLALGLTLLGDALACGVVAAFSSYRGAFAGAQDVPAAILTLAVAAALSVLPAATNPDTKFATVLMLVMLTTLATGLFFLVVGYFKWGGLARFLPYPVMGGFLAGTGWLLVIGGLSLAIDLSGDVLLLQIDALEHWLPALIFGVVLLLASQRWKNPLIMPGLIVAGISLFYLVVWQQNISIEQLRHQGWLLAEFPAGGAWRFPLSGEFLAQADWSVVFGQVVSLAPIVIISVVAMLLNLNGLELILKRDLDLNRELLVVGFGNLMSGLAGGLPGFSDISFSALNKRLAGGTGLVGFIVSGLLVLTVFAGASFLGYFPRPVLAGVIFYIGLSLLFEWTYRAWFKFPHIDFAILLTILAVIALRGFLEGVAVGLVAAIVLFVVNYSRTSVIRHALSGTEFRSRVHRSPDRRAVLEAQNAQLYILELQGFIFFGTANNLYEQVKQRLTDGTLPPARLVVLDFGRVTGLDSTGLLSFDKLLSFTREQAITLVFTGLSNVGVQHVSIREQLARGGFTDHAEGLRMFTDLDRGIEWCEDQIIAQAQLAAEEKNLIDYFADTIPSDQMRQIIGYMERCEFAAGEYLMRLGDEADDLFFVESGQVTSQIEHPDQKTIRLETMRGGRAVGELGFYLGAQRTADVIANEATVAYRLTHAALGNMEHSDPPAALVFHRLIVHLLGERTVHLMRSVQALHR